MRTWLWVLLALLSSSPAWAQREAKKATRQTKAVKAAPPGQAVSVGDTLYYFFSHGKVSTKVYKPRSDWGWVKLYNRQGAETYLHKIGRMSFTISADPEFRPDGSVSKLKTYLNPGASMYWYEGEITFSTNNEPEWKRDIRRPDYEASDWYWHKPTGTWKRQEVSVENLPPPQLTPLPTVKPAKPTKPQPKAVARPEGDTVYHRYSNGRISVKITPWLEYKKELRFYSPEGRLQYTLENWRMHVNSHTDLVFYDNGAVREARTSSQPDGGIQHFQETVTFSERNTPMRRTSREDLGHPRVTLPTHDVWDSTARAWLERPGP